MNKNKNLDQLALSPILKSASLTAIPTLAKSELHLWCLPLTLSAQEQETALSWLSDIQKDKYHRRRTPQLKEAYLAGRYYLLRLLAQYSQCSPQEIELSYTRLNKPYLSNKQLADEETSLHFNFTDTQCGSEHVGLFAFCLDKEVGVDLEALDRRSQFDLIAEKRFSKAEQELVFKHGELCAETFLYLWTRKEASGKATGQGINFKMNERNLVSDNNAELNFVDEDQQAWHLTQLKLSEKLIACVVYSGHEALTINGFDKLET